jgi:hypothetical protein
VGIDRNTAWAELHDVATGPERLRDIAAEHPEFAEAIGGHPSAYPELIEWMRSLPADATDVPDEQDDLRDRDTSAERLMSIAQARPDLIDEIAAHPNVYPELVEWMRSTYVDPVPADEVPLIAQIPLIEHVPVEPGPRLEAEHEQLDVEDKVLIASATGAQAFDEIGFVFAVQEIASGQQRRIRELVRPEDTLHVALPGILVSADRHDAIALFTDDRLILLPQRAAAGTRVVRYADVTAARIGVAPSELSEMLALYVQAEETHIFAVPTDDPEHAEFLAHLVRGVPLAQVRPDLVAEAAPAAGTTASPELDAARTELADPAISGARIAALAAEHPELHAELAGHARSYPDLLDWLETRPDPAARAAVAARRARDAGGVVVSTTSAAHAPARLSGPNPIAGKSGWEHADKALDTADRVANAAVNVAAVIYGLFLIVAGIAVAALAFGAGNGAGFFGILIAVYGVYVALPLPGAKIIIW